ncbi:hypothetical protein [Shewanella sp. DC2-4]|uniref:hypothetical protein n=1 Tax=Shewanella sp. DC2-4 TaxID=2739431 RepID=UPI0035CCE041
MSTEKKAKFHLAAIAGAVTIGTVLAPFTLGFSLLPTVFVVMYGNASAIAMYGGSQFVTGDKEKKKAPFEPPKVDAPKDLPTKRPFHLPPLAELPEPKHTEDVTDKDTERGDVFNNCFNNVNNFHNSWYVFINSSKVPDINLVSEDQVKTPNESHVNNIGTQTTDATSIGRVTLPFADAAEVTVVETPVKERQARLKTLISECQEQADPQLVTLFNLLLSGDDACAQMVEIKGKDGATAYAVIPNSESLVIDEHDRATGSDVPRPLAGTTTKTTTPVATQTDDTPATVTGNGSPSMTDDGTQTDVPTAVADTPTNAGTSARPPVAANTTNTPVTSQTDGVPTEDTPATVVPEANAAQGYTGRKWEVSSSTPVNLSQGAQTGSNYTPGPRRNLGTTPDAAPSAATAHPRGPVGNGSGTTPSVTGNGSPLMTDDGTQTDVPTVVADTPTNAGTSARPPVAANITSTRQTTTPAMSQTDGVPTEDTPATEVPEANAAQGYTGRKWEVSSSTPVNLSQGAQTGSNYTQGPRRNLGTTPDAAPSTATGHPGGPAAGNGSGTTPPVMGNGSPSMTDDGTQVDVPTVVADTPTNAGTPARPPVAAKTTSTPVTSQTDGVPTEDTPATVVPEANAAQGYTGRKWEVSSSTPVNLSQGAQTGSNYTQGPRRNLGATPDAAPSTATGHPRGPAAGNGSGTTPAVTGNGSPSVADVTDDGTQADVPTNTGTPARSPVAANTTNTPSMSQTDGVPTEDTPATVVPEANAAQGYTGRKWEVSSSTPVNLSQGAQTGSNYTQGPRRNLGATPDAAPSTATGHPRGPAAGNGSGTTPPVMGNGSPSMTDDGTQTDVPTAVADTPTNAGTPARSPVAANTTNTPSMSQTDGVPTEDTPATVVPEANAAQGYTGRKWEVSSSTPVNLSQGAQTGSNYTQGPRRNLGATPDAAPSTATGHPRGPAAGNGSGTTPAVTGNGSPSVADVTDDGTQADVPTNTGTPARSPVAANTTNTPSMSQTDGVPTEDTPATVVPEANAAQGYTGRKWEVSSSTPVNLSQGAQTGSNYTQGPRRNLGATPDAAPSTATGHSRGPAAGNDSGTTPPVMGNGSPSVADVTDDGTQADVPTNTGTPARSPVAANTTNTPSMSQMDGVPTEDTPATVVPEANAAQGYTGRKWEVSSSTPVNLSQGAQTGSNYTQGPRRNLGTTPDAAPSTATGHPRGPAAGNGSGTTPPVMGNGSPSMTDDGTQTDVPTAVADTPTNAGTPARPPVAAKTTNTPVTSQTDGVPTEDTPATVVPEANAAQGYTGRKWEVSSSTPVNLSQGAQTGSNYTQGPRRNLGATPDAAPSTATGHPRGPAAGNGSGTTPAVTGNGSPSVADVTDDGTQADVPTNTGTPARSPVAANTTNTPSMSQTDGVPTEDTPATVVPEANAAQGYTGRKWEVSSSTPVNLSQGAQTGSNYTQGPRRNLGATPDAAPSTATGHPRGPAAGNGSGTTPAVTGNGSPSVADVTDDGTQADVPTNTGTPARSPVAANTTNTPSMSQTDGVPTEDTPATVVPEANAAQGYTGRKWEVSSSTPVNLSQGAQTGSNYTQGPRRNLGATPDAAPSTATGHPRGPAAGNGSGTTPAVTGNGSPSVADVTDDGTQADVPTNTGTPARSPVAANTTNTPSMSQTDGVPTEDTPATVVPEANAAQGYTGRKWEVSSSTPVNLSQGAQTGSNYTQGPRRNLGATPDAAPSTATGHSRGPAAGNDSGTTPPVMGNGSPSVADVTDDGTQADVPTNTGTPARSPVAAKTTNTPSMSQTDGVPTEDTPATVVPEANAAQGYTGRKWEVSSSTPVNLSQGAQTGSNYTQGPRRNLGTTPDAAPSSAIAHPRGPVPATGNGSLSMTDDGTQTDVPTAVAETPTNAGTSARPPVAANTTNTPVTSQTDGVPTDDTPATVVPEANAAKGYTGRKWEVSSPTPVSLSQGAQTGSNYTQGPRRNLGTTPDAVPSAATAHPRGPAAGNGSGTTSAATGNGSPSMTDGEVGVVATLVNTLTPVSTETAGPVITAESQKSTAKPQLDLGKIESRIVGRAGGHIQHRVPKFLDRPEAGTLMGSWRPIPESLRGKKDSAEFEEWRKQDLGQYLKSLNSKVLLTQGATSMRGQNHFAGKLNNLRDRAEIKSQLNPVNRMNKSDYQQISGLDLVSTGRSYLLGTASGKLIVTSPVIRSNLVLAP